MYGRAMCKRVAHQRLAQGANLLLDAMAILATLQVLLDLARVYQIDFTIDISMKQLANLVVGNLPCSVDDIARYAAEQALAAKLRIAIALADAALG